MGRTENLKYILHQGAQQILTCEGKKTEQNSKTNLPTNQNQQQQKKPQPTTTKPTNKTTKYPKQKKPKPNPKLHRLILAIPPLPGASLGNVRSEPLCVPNHAPALSRAPRAHGSRSPAAAVAHRQLRAGAAPREVAQPPPAGRVPGLGAGLPARRLRAPRSVTSGFGGGGRRKGPRWRGEARSTHSSGPHRGSGSTGPWGRGEAGSPPAAWRRILARMRQRRQGSPAAKGWGPRSEAASGAGRRGRCWAGLWQGQGWGRRAGAS